MCIRDSYSLEQFKKDFDIDYAVSGSIRVVNNRIRISVELSELNDGNVIWGNKYDRVKEDIFDIQDEIVRKITISLIGEIELSSLERAKRKPTENMNSYECLLKGKELHHRFTKEDNQECIKALDLSIKADTNNSQAYAWKACALGQAYGRGYRNDTEQLMTEIMLNINKAVELNNNDFEAHRMLAEVHLSLHDFEKAIDHGSKAFKLNPNDPRVSSVYGEILIRTNKLDEGISYLEKAYELDPIPQGQSTSDRRICALLTGYYISDNFEKCSEMINKIVDIDFKSWLLSYDIYKKNDSFIASSELKAIKEVIDENLTIDYESVEIFFQLTYIPAPRSIYREIKKLRANSVLILSTNTLDYKFKHIILTSIHQLPQKKNKIKTNCEQCSGPGGHI